MPTRNKRYIPRGVRPTPKNTGEPGYTQDKIKARQLRRQYRRRHYGAFQDRDREV